MTSAGKVPGATHKVHTDAEVAPSAVEAVKASHCVQAEEPVLVRNVPAEQLEHALLPAKEYAPAEQFTHAAAMAPEAVA